MDFRKFYIPTVMAGLALITSANQAQAQTTSDLTGTYSCPGTTVRDNIRQVGSELWELSYSPQSTSVFHGTVLNGFINATWTEFPNAGYGNAINYGYVSGKVVSPNTITFTITYTSPGFEGLLTSATCTR